MKCLRNLLVVVPAISLFSINAMAATGCMLGGSDNDFGYGFSRWVGPFQVDKTNNKVVKVGFCKQIGGPPPFYIKCTTFDAQNNNCEVNSYQIKDQGYQGTG
jgi:hypothetical protein